MNPFDLPPAGSPVSVDAPELAGAKPRRGRMALVAVLTAGLIGGGIAGISQLAAADRPDLAAQATDETVPPVDDIVPTVDDTVPSVDESGDSSEPEPVDGPEPLPVPDEPVVEGEIVFDIGDGDPIVIDLADADADAIKRLSECIGFPQFDFDFDFDVGSGDWEPSEFSLDLDEFLDGLPFDLEQLDAEFGDFGGFDSDGSVTITGPDGVSVVDLGDGGSVTVTKDGDDVTIITDGDATVNELSDVFGDFGAIFESEGSLFGDESFDDFLEKLPAFDELPEFAPADPETVRACADEVFGR